ncbi:hypothetical protein GFH30_03195 [Acinetobacter wanghuae]|uniref:DUF4870 domain-containing protein n=1 Tax=Acinetobacter wanghuae TaxID=2662362 RepID=A0A5Q0P158_9GAMM|nr:ABZJ_00895 family protein [Acinetobacter wanghuae]MQW92218.1 hypothetical protein [Acinetobacter wanghuae]QGA10466.1 hypothetical protein GFH30_03195 [Acinetobacter wanghuae]
MSLTRYFIWFFCLCFIFTCVCGVLAALMPQGMGAVLTIFPYLIPMIWVLFKFLKREQRAPTQAERKKITWGFSLIYWLYNLTFLLLGIWVATFSNPNAWSDFQLYLQEPQFMTMVLTMCLLIAIPMYVLTYWFYGPQAKRMAQKMFSSS